MNVQDLLQQIKPQLEEVKVEFNLTGELDIQESYLMEADEIEESLEEYKLQPNTKYFAHSGTFNEDQFFIIIVTKEDGTPVVLQVTNEDCVPVKTMELK